VLVVVAAHCVVGAHAKLVHVDAAYISSTAHLGVRRFDQTAIVIYTHLGLKKGIVMPPRKQEEEEEQRQAHVLDDTAEVLYRWARDISSPPLVQKVPLEPLPINYGVRSSFSR